MPGTKQGHQKRRAKQIGLSLEEYLLIIEADNKWCTSCKGFHPLSAFNKDASRSDGLTSSCWQSRLSGTYPGKRERQEKRLIGFAWCSGCKEWLLTKDVRNGKCAECLRAYGRDWYERLGRERLVARASFRRRGVEPLSNVAKEYLTELFEGQCAYGCGRKASSWDHIWPVAKGGKTIPGNIVPSCRSCNAQKWSNDPYPWVARGFSLLPDPWEGLLDQLIFSSDDKWGAYCG